MTKTLTIQIPRPEAKNYKIYIGQELLQSLPEILKQHASSGKQNKPVSRYIIITDSSVKKIFGEKLLQTLKKTGLQIDLISFPSGEKNKNEQTHLKLTHQMLAKKCGRDTMVLTLGGGVVGDMAGYVAATYMRGIPFIQIPTSLLAMVDSSIGGKVGVDTPYGKNLIGAFWHPKAVIADVDCLKNLPNEQLVNGLMEAVKIFLTYDKASFEFTKKNWRELLAKKNEQNKNRQIMAKSRDSHKINSPDLLKNAESSQIKDGTKILQKIISRAIELKIGVVIRDEHEANERMVVNWGHTIGHAVEHLSGYKLLHGYSVALGILVESKIAQLLSVLSEKDFQTIRSSMEKFGIQEKDLQKFKVTDILKQTLIDKKSRNGKVKYVLLEKIGKVKTINGRFGHEVDQKIVKRALKFFIK